MIARRKLSVTTNSVWKVFLRLKLNWMLKFATWLKSHINAWICSFFVTLCYPTTVHTMELNTELSNIWYIIFFSSQFIRSSVIFQQLVDFSAYHDIFWKKT